MTDHPAVQPAAPSAVQPAVQPAARRDAAPAVHPASTITGTPDAPALKRRPVLFAVFLLLYAAFMALLIVWALRLRHAH